MDTLKYIGKNVARNKLRASLTILSVGFSLALMTVLMGYMATQALWKDDASKHHRIVVMNTQGFSGVVPIAYVDRIRGIDGIADAVPYSWFGGNYKDEQQMSFAQFGTDPQHVFAVWDEYSIPQNELQAWQSNRRGCVVDRRLAARRGWKIGEKIPLKGTFFPVNLDLELVGLFDSPQEVLWFDWQYLDESRRALSAPSAGNSGTIFAKAKNAEQMASISQAIDKRFANSDNPTLTQTEAAFAQIFSDMLGNIQEYIRNIGLAVVFSLSLVAGNTMAMSIRERTTEIAVLKAIGFPRWRIMVMILGEACSISLLGGLLGIVTGCASLELLHQVARQFFPVSIFNLAGPWILSLLALAAGIGILSGVVPAVRAGQRSIVDGLRRVI